MASLYEPLNPQRREIRVLRLIDDYHANDDKEIHNDNNATGVGPIKCELATCSLLDSPNFEALSYCWVDGRPFRVRPNLFAYLQTMREEQDHGWLYVDAICINQDDIGERNNQVDFMGDVYRSADIVIAFLGMASENDRVFVEKMQTTCDILADLLAQNETTCSDEGNLQHNQELSPDDLFSDVSLKRTLLHMAELVDLREYWTSMWVIQEMIVARELIFRVSKCLMSEEVLAFLLKSWPICAFPRQTQANLPLLRNTSRLGGTPELSFLNALPILHLRQKVKAVQVGQLHPDIQFHKAVTMSCAQECSNKHDKVSALLGMTSTTCIPVNYGMSPYELLAHSLVTGIQYIIRAANASYIRLDSKNLAHQIPMFYLAIHTALDIVPTDPTALLVLHCVALMTKLPQSITMELINTGTRSRILKLTGRWNQFFGKPMTLRFRSMVHPVLRAFYQTRWHLSYPAYASVLAFAAPKLLSLQKALQHYTEPVSPSVVASWRDAIEVTSMRATEEKPASSLAPFHREQHCRNELGKSWAALRHCFTTIAQCFDRPTTILPFLITGSSFGEMSDMESAVFYLSTESFMQALGVKHQQVEGYRAAVQAENANTMLAID